MDGAEDEDEDAAEAAGAGAGAGAGVGSVATPRLSDDGVTPAGTRGWARRHGRGVLHCVDDCSHAHTTAHRVRRREPEPEPEPEPALPRVLAPAASQRCPTFTAADLHPSQVREAADQMGLASHLKLHICDAYALADTFDDDASNFTFDGDDGAGGVERDGGGGGGGGGDDDDDDRMLDLLWLDFGAGVGGRLHSFLSAWWQRLHGQKA